MLRHLQRTLECALTVHFKNLQFDQLVALRGRSLFTHQAPKLATTNDTASTTDTPNQHASATDIDHDYVDPYRVSNEHGTSAGILVESLKQRFRLNDMDVQKIMGDETVIRNYRKRDLSNTMEMLCIEGVTKQNFVNYPWLLTLDISRLPLKIGLIKSMPVRDFNDFVPFLSLTVPRLRKLVASLNQESLSIPFGNRVYYISKRLQIEPAIVTKYLAKRLFILEMPYEMFEQNLQHMLNYNVSSINILKDLWAFRYTPKSVQLRLERAKRANKDKIMPWMVRCPEPILQRSLKLSLDELKVLGEFNTTVEYLAHRLQFTVVEMKAIMDKHPQVHTVRVTKIKEVLDYLMNEADFSRFEIAQVPRILCHSLKTTKERLDELKTLGCRPTSLVIVCRSKREYAKFLYQWQKYGKQLENSSEIGSITET